MTKFYLILIISLFNLNSLVGQTESEFKILLNQIGETKKSTKIYKTKQTKKIVSYGKESLPILAKFFTDSTSTNVFSECYGKGYSIEDKKAIRININGNLSIGEVAILIAHHIEYMNLMKIMGTHSCAPFTCKKFNGVESDLPFINEFGINRFKNKYEDWLNSKKRSDWLNLISKKSR